MVNPASNELGPLEMFKNRLFGCGDEVYHCNHSGLPVPADPDIAGLGVSPLLRQEHC